MASVPQHSSALLVVVAVTGASRDTRRIRMMAGAAYLCNGKVACCGTKHDVQSGDEVFGVIQFKSHHFQGRPLQKSLIDPCGAHYDKALLRSHAASVSISGKHSRENTFSFHTDVSEYASHPLQGY